MNRLAFKPLLRAARAAHRLCVRFCREPEDVRLVLRGVAPRGDDSRHGHQRRDVERVTVGYTGEGADVQDKLLWFEGGTGRGVGGNCGWGPEAKGGDAADEGGGASSAGYARRKSNGSSRFGT